MRPEQGEGPHEAEDKGRDEGAGRGALHVSFKQLFEKAKEDQQRNEAEV